MFLSSSIKSDINDQNIQNKGKTNGRKHNLGLQPIVNKV